MRRLMIAGGVLAAMLLPATEAAAATGIPQRPAGAVVPVQSSNNGGDNGWGNCGHNSSGGTSHTGLMGPGGGNGGNRPGEPCLPWTDGSLDLQVDSTPSGLTYS